MSLTDGDGSARRDEEATIFIWKRAATLVVGIEFVTALIGLVNTVSQLMKLKLPETQGTPESVSISDLSVTDATATDSSWHDQMKDGFQRGMHAEQLQRESQLRDYEVKVMHTILVLYVTVYIFMVLFNILLLIGIKKSKTILLKIWHRFSMFLIGLYILASLVEAAIAPQTASTPPELVIRIFMTWILHEYLKAIAAGLVHRQRSESLTTLTTNMA